MAEAHKLVHPSMAAISRLLEAEEAEPLPQKAGAFASQALLQLVELDFAADTVVLVVAAAEERMAAAGVGLHKLEHGYFEAGTNSAWAVEEALAIEVEDTEATKGE